MYFDSLTHITEDGSWFDTGCDASLKRLIDECSGGGVGRALLVGLPGVVDNDFVLATAASHPRLFVPIAGLDPTQYASSDETAAELERLATAGFKGVKLHPRFGGYHPLDKGVIRTLEAAGSLGLVVLICTVWIPTASAKQSLNMPVWQIIGELCEASRTRAKDTSVIFLHGGYFDFFQTAEVVKGFDNAFLDLSCTLKRYSEAMRRQFEFVLERFDRKVVLGSDFPEHTYSEVVDVLDSFELSSEKRENIVYGNLARIFEDF